ncbi:hypothetical protein EXIGLDRAFT_693833 [Exidia glandulosa HHB12029]|uniref:Uncharacterized protein n=1 Tax=Exidia glandulosa HHB12029 TaxID=1314781 RepID=A0A166BHB9_EXIGL|nr:hypothetical protein EXIGLDRAFT_693833 [Exidia glandulosa HHB12029]
MSSHLLSWQQGSNSRGSYDIVSLCASTLLICVWSAVHVDIPTRQTFQSTYVKRIGWLVVGMVLPEMLVITALGQLIVARELVKAAQTYLPATQPASPSLWRIYVDVARHYTLSVRAWLRRVLPPAVPLSGEAASSDTGWRGPGTGGDIEQPSTGEGPRRTHPWTLVHGFYAAMGGFVIETSPGPPFLPLADTRVVISRTGIQYLMEHAPELIPDIATDDIADRSKVSAISKALLCCQVFYFCGSCAARLSQDLPLTLLEITTFAHSLCTLFAYALWWYKPQDVGEPTLISGERARELCALMFMSTNPESYYPLGLGRSHFWPAELEYLNIFPCSEMQATRDLEKTEGRQEPLPFLHTRTFLGFAPKSRVAVYELLNDFMPPEIRSIFSSAYAPWYLRHTRPWYMPPIRQVDWSLDQRDITRFKLCRRALSSFPPIFAPSIPWHDRWPFLNMTQQLGQPLERFPRLYLRLAPALIALLYGLPHFLAWWQEFPGAQEQYEWHVASITVIAAPTLAFLFLWLRIPDETSDNQLFALPPGAFQEAHMTFYWPHFS